MRGCRGSAGNKHVVVLVVAVLLLLVLLVGPATRLEELTRKSVTNTTRRRSAADPPPKTKSRRGAAAPPKPSASAVEVPAAERAAWERIVVAPLMVALSEASALQAESAALRVQCAMDPSDSERCRLRGRPYDPQCSRGCSRTEADRRGGPIAHVCVRVRFE